jgi:RNA polymerase sigma-B factor
VRGGPRAVPQGKAGERHERHASQLASASCRSRVSSRAANQRADEPLDDLVQVASLGLIKAIDRFDPAREVAFSSYAVPTILGELKRHFRDRTWSVRVPRDLQELALRVDKAVAQLSRDLRRQPSCSRSARRRAPTRSRCSRRSRPPAPTARPSFDAPRSNEDDGGDSLGDAFGGDESGFGLAEDRATLERLMAAITPREREVLRLRFVEDLTQAEIGAASACRRCRSRA